MNFLITLAHPDKSSFNHAIAGKVSGTLKEKEHSVIFHDLYAERFDPLLPAEELTREGRVSADVKKHCNELINADGIIIVHPNWWGQPPAVLKGWIDRVIRPDVAYRFIEGDKGEGVPVGLLKAKGAIVFNTSNTPDVREQEIFGDPLELIWKKCIFDLCGVKNVKRRMFNVVVTSSSEQRTEWLEEVMKITGEMFL